MPQRIEVKIPWSKADKKAKGDCDAVLSYIAVLFMIKDCFSIVYILVAYCLVIDQLDFN